MDALDQPQVSSWEVLAAMIEGEARYARRHEFDRSTVFLSEDDSKAIVAALRAQDDRDQPPASSGKALTGKAQGAWRPIAEAPKDGTEIWAWLSDSGVRKVRWWSAEELCEEEGRYTPDFYQAGFYEVADKTEWWNPAWWAPADRLPAPPAPSGQGGR